MVAKKSVKKKPEKSLAKKVPVRKKKAAKKSPEKKTPAKVKKKKSVSKRLGRPKSITVEEYNKLWLAYNERQSVKHCSEKAGVGYECAHRYILGEGRPKDGMMQIRQRFLTAMAEAQEREEQTLVEWQMSQLKDAKSVLGLHLAEFGVHQRDVKARVAEHDRVIKENPQSTKSPILAMSLDRLVSSYERMTRLIEHLMGAADMSVEHREKSRFAGWTREEKVLFATKGIFPEHER